MATSFNHKPPIIPAAGKLENPLPVIEPYGSKFFSTNGNQFFIRGVNYQLGGSASLEDGLANGPQCKIDAALMKELGVNTVRIYFVLPDDNHDECMQAFNDAGIYVLIDLPTPQHSINRVKWRWTLDLYESYTQSFDAFAGYENLLGVNVGNEAVNDMETAEVALYIKAAVRDVRSFRDYRGYRKIPIGYSSADDSSINPYIQYYMSCGGNPNETVDFFAYNNYAWCGNSSFPESGYSTFLEYAARSNIPLFFSEEGCNQIAPREFTDQSSIFGSAMSPLWSGTLIYEWSQEANEYGLVDYGDTTPSGTSTVTPTPLADYSNLSRQWKSVTMPEGAKRSEYTPSVPTPVCPTSTSDGWPIDPSIGPPTIANLEISTVARVTTIPPTGTKASSGASGLTKPSGASSSSNITSSPPTDNGGAGQGGGLSTSTKVILGVVIPVGVITLVLIVTYLAIRRRRRRRAENDRKTYKDIPPGSQPELAGVPVAQLDAGREHEVVVERQELEGASRGAGRRAKTGRAAGGEVCEMPS